MRATLISRDGNEAVVEMRPGWLARLFGARVTRCHLKRGEHGWRHEATGTAVGSRITTALDFVPYGAGRVPSAVANPTGKRVGG